MTSLILTALCAITLGMHSPAVQDTTVSYMIDGKMVKAFNGSQLNGKAIASYTIDMVKDHHGNVTKVHYIKTAEAPQQKEDTQYYVDDQVVSESTFKKINNADIKQIMFYKAGSEAAMTLTGSALVGAVKVTLKDESISKNAEELNEVLVMSYGRKKATADLYKTNEKVIPINQVDVKPGFQGGDVNNFFKWVNARLNYPEAAITAGVQGRVVVSFKVNSDGKVSDIDVLRGVCDALDQEAVRVISSSPNWTPGKRKGKNVAVSYTFPVVFMLR